jgi:hypothetical protein
MSLSNTDGVATAHIAAIKPQNYPIFLIQQIYCPALLHGQAYKREDTAYLCKKDLCWDESEQH